MSTLITKGCPKVTVNSRAKTCAERARVPVTTAVPLYSCAITSVSVSFCLLWWQHSVMPGRWLCELRLNVCYAQLFSHLAICHFGQLAHKEILHILHIHTTVKPPWIINHTAWSRWESGGAKHPCRGLSSVFTAWLWLPAKTIVGAHVREKKPPGRIVSLSLKRLGHKMKSSLLKMELAAACVSEEANSKGFLSQGLLKGDSM